MTYHTPPVDESPDRPTLPEIEITPEMVEAGAHVMEDYYMGEGRYLIPEEGLSRIFRAMIRAQ